MGPDIEMINCSQIKDLGLSGKISLNRREQIAQHERNCLKEDLWDCQLVSKMYHNVLSGLSKGAGNFFLRYVKLAGGPSLAGGGEV